MKKLFILIYINIVANASVGAERYFEAQARGEDTYSWIATIIVLIIGLSIYAKTKK